MNPQTIQLEQSEFFRLDQALNEKIGEIVDSFKTKGEKMGEMMADFLGQAKNGILKSTTCCSSTDDFENIDPSCEYPLGIKCNFCYINLCDVLAIRYFTGFGVGTTQAPNDYGPVQQVYNSIGQTWCSFDFEPESGEFNYSLNKDEERFENIYKFLVKSLTDQLNRFMSLVKKRKILIVWCDADGTRFILGNMDQPAEVSEISGSITQTTNEHTLSFLEKSCAPTRRYLGTTSKKP